MAPDAEPPESKAMEVKIPGTKSVITKASKYPGTIIHQMLISYRILRQARPTATATPTESEKFITFLGIAPLVTFSTWCVSTVTAGSATTIVNPKNIPTMINTQLCSERAISLPSLSPIGKYP